MAEQNSERLRDPERTREAILAAAEDRFARLGFEGTSLQQIAEAAGVARSTPAYFFGTKQELYDAVLARGVARISCERLHVRGADGRRRVRASNGTEALARPASRPTSRACLRRPAVRK